MCRDLSRLDFVLQPIEQRRIRANDYKVRLERHFTMPEYDLHVICPHCKDFHDAFLRISLDETFDVLRVSDVYKENVPPEFYQAASSVRCWATNKTGMETDPDMMVLAEVGRWSSRKKVG